jgi:hypothetical protein
MRWTLLILLSINCNTTINASSDAGGDAPGDSLGDGGNPSGDFAIVHSFDGDNGVAATGRGKPELNVAANGTQVMQTTWQNVNVYDYTGTLLQSTTLPALVTSAGLDPRAPTSASRSSPTSSSTSSSSAGSSPRRAGLTASW